jgi:hypothetical protein
VTLALHKVFTIFISERGEGEVVERERVLTGGGGGGEGN